MTCLPVSFSGPKYSAVSVSTPYSRRHPRVQSNRERASFTDHLAARRYRSRHSRVSHIRSASVMGAVEVFAASVVGTVVHEVTVERREWYFAD